MSGASARFLAHDTGPGVATLRQQVERGLLAACGVPPELTTGDADGTGRREAFRQFLVGTLQPWARIIETEAAAKLEAPVELSLRSFRAADIAGRARSYKQLREAGVDADRAAEAVGLDD